MSARRVTDIAVGVVGLGLAGLCVSCAATCVWLVGVLIAERGAIAEASRSVLGLRSWAWPDGGLGVLQDLAVVAVAAGVAGGGWLMFTEPRVRGTQVKCAVVGVLLAGVALGVFWPDAFRGLCHGVTVDGHLSWEQRPLSAEYFRAKRVAEACLSEGRQLPRGELMVLREFRDKAVRWPDPEVLTTARLILDLGDKGLCDGFSEWLTWALRSRWWPLVRLGTAYLEPGGRKRMRVAVPAERSERDFIGDSRERQRVVDMALRAARVSGEPKLTARADAVAAALMK